MIQWQGNQFLGAVEGELYKRFVKAGVYFTSQTRKALNKSQPYKRSGARLIGLNPSAPGEFPRKLSGQLQRSITWRVTPSPLVLTVGSNLRGYPGFLQQGTRFMRPRPWLSLSFDKERQAIGKILVG